MGERARGASQEGRDDVAAQLVVASVQDGLDMKRSLTRPAVGRKVLDWSDGDLLQRLLGYCVKGRRHRILSLKFNTPPTVSWFMFFLSIKSFTLPTTVGVEAISSSCVFGES